MAFRPHTHSLSIQAGTRGVLTPTARTGGPARCPTTTLGVVAATLTGTAKTSGLRSTGRATKDAASAVGRATTTMPAGDAVSTDISAETVHQIADKSQRRQGPSAAAQPFQPGVATARPWTSQDSAWGKPHPQLPHPPVQPSGAAPSANQQGPV